MIQKVPAKTEQVIEASDKPEQAVNNQFTIVDARLYTSEFCVPIKVFVSFIKDLSVMTNLDKNVW